jgi:cell division protein FtsW
MTKAYSLIICVAILFLIGSLMVYNTTSAEIIDKSLNLALNTSFFKQLTYALIGLAFSFMILKVGVDQVFIRSGWIYLVLCLLLIAVFIPGIGMQLNGAKRWIRVFGLSFQPSEFMKIFLPIFLIRQMLLKPICSLRDFLKIMTYIIPPMFLILLEPDNGTFVIIMATILVLLYLFQVNKKYWLLPCFIMIAVACSIAINMPHVMNRIEIYIHPEKDLLGKGHQPYQAKIAVGSGQWLGRGMGQSLQKLTYLPEARSDYIAAIFAEEFGFLGCLVLISLYFLLAWIGTMIALESKRQEGFYLGIILVFLISFQVFLNLGVVSGLLPSKGTNLPFFSQGGSSLVANFLAIALLFSIASKYRVQAHE